MTNCNFITSKHTVVLITSAAYPVIEKAVSKDVVRAFFVYVVNGSGYMMTWKSISNRPMAMGHYYKNNQPSLRIIITRGILSIPIG